jgi:itaconyl-CoA hydratase
MTVKQGWTGRVYEDFEIGDIYQHPLGRTVIAADNIWFTLLTQNTNPIHFDTAYSAQTEYGKPLVDSTFPGDWTIRIRRFAKRHGQSWLG